MSIFLILCFYVFTAHVNLIEYHKSTFTQHNCYIDMQGVTYYMESYTHITHPNSKDKRMGTAIYAHTHKAALTRDMDTRMHSDMQGILNKEPSTTQSNPTRYRSKACSNFASIRHTAPYGTNEGNTHTHTDNRTQARTRNSWANHTYLRWSLHTHTS
jgi:hypothetical protein